MGAAEILVIILSIALAIFLTLGIILTVYLIIIAKKLRNVASTAERAVGHFENIAALARKAAAPALISKALLEIVSRFAQRNNTSKKKEDDDES